MNALSDCLPTQDGPQTWPRLVRQPDLSVGRSRSGNKVIQGENLDALRTLRDEFRQTVRCIYIDPPYNNLERYAHYVDVLPHDTWLSQVTERAELLRDFLTDDGSLWVSIDDRNVHYLKTALDPIFGRSNFVTTIVWQHRTTRENRKVVSNNHEYLLLYAKNIKQFSSARNLLPASEALASRYKNPDSDPRGPWQSISLNTQGGHGTASQNYVLVAPNGTQHCAPSGRCWAYTQEQVQRLIADNRVWFGKDGRGTPRLKKFLSEARPGLVPDTLWLACDVGTTDHAKKHLKRLLPSEAVFETPKPEGLLAKILSIATDRDDLVLDAYLGSGTTAAVAHKLGRRYIGIEQGIQAVTHCAERLRKVIRNEDPDGVTSQSSWSGGGGFDFYRVERDKSARARSLRQPRSRLVARPTSA